MVIEGAPEDMEYTFMREVTDQWAVQPSLSLDTDCGSYIMILSPGSLYLDSISKVTLSKHHLKNYPLTLSQHHLNTILHFIPYILH